MPPEMPTDNVSSPWFTMSASASEIEATAMILDGLTTSNPQDDATATSSKAGDSDLEQAIKDPQEFEKQEEVESSSETDLDPTVATITETATPAAAPIAPTPVQSLKTALKRGYETPRIDKTGASKRVRFGVSETTTHAPDQNGRGKAETRMEPYPLPLQDTET